MMIIHEKRIAELFVILKDHFGEYLPHGLMLEKFFEIDIKETIEFNPQNGDYEITIKVLPYGKSKNK